MSDIPVPDDWAPLPKALPPRSPPKVPALPLHQVTAAAAAEAAKEANLQVVVKSSSTPSFGGWREEPRRVPQRHTNPLKDKPAFKVPWVDRYGFPCPAPQQRRLFPEPEWDGRHHVSASENELKPRDRRQYFSSPEKLSEVKERLSKDAANHKVAREVLRNLEMPDLPLPKRSPYSADTGAPLCPERHVPGGTMRDRDGRSRAWNERFQATISVINENCHPDHRAYFNQRSLFEESPSQSWRRFLDQEVGQSVWIPIAMKKAPRFPPLGGRLTGRSGSPVPEPRVLSAEAGREPRRGAAAAPPAVVVVAAAAEPDGS